MLVSLFCLVSINFARIAGKSILEGKPSNQCKYHSNDTYSTTHSHLLFDTIMFYGNPIKIQFDIKLNERCNKTCNIFYIGRDSRNGLLSLSVNGINNYFELSITNKYEYSDIFRIPLVDMLLPIDEQYHTIYVSHSIDNDNSLKTTFEIDTYALSYLSQSSLPLVPVLSPNQTDSWPFYMSSPWILGLNAEINSIYVLTKSITINFTSTISDASQNVWPSDGFSIKYYIDDWNLCANSPVDIYYISLNDKENGINASITLNTSKDHCICNIYKCSDCYQHFDLGQYLSSIQNNIYINQLQFTPIQNNINYNFDVLMQFTPKQIPIKLERCNISVIVPSIIDNHNSSITFKFDLSSNCYSIIGQTFVVNITAVSLDISKQLIIDINTNRSIMCKICNENSTDDCVCCNENTFILHYQLNDNDSNDSTHNIFVESNMIDLRVMSPTHTMFYFEYKYISFSYNFNYYLWLLLILPFIIIILWCMYRRRQYMKAFVVDKALVLIIGISQFDKKEYFLSGVRINVGELKHLWRDQYQYDVCVCNEKTLYSTKQDVIDFIDTHKKKLETNEYQCVIIHILSHGVDQGDSFLTSDTRKIYTDFIRWEFTNIEELLTSDTALIKIIFHHGCRGEDKYVGNVITRGIKYGGCRDDANDTIISEDSNWAVVWGNIKDRTVSDSGAFTDCICKSFGENLQKTWKIDFRTLMTEIGINLDKKTNGAEIVNVNETLRVHSIRFEMYLNVKQKKKEDQVNELEYIRMSKKTGSEITYLNSKPSSKYVD
eukprot:222843_1